MMEKKDIIERNALKDYERNNNIHIIFYVIIAIFVGALITILIYKPNLNTYKQNVINEDIKTTTLEEVSDLKKGINSVYESTVYISKEN